MPSIDDFERKVVESFADATKLGESLDALLGYLLSSVAGYSRRPTDGVLLEHSRIDSRQAFASGVVVMIEQTVSYGSREHRKLRDAALLGPVHSATWPCARGGG